MGAGQSSQAHSSTRGNESVSPETRTCYYELLGVERRATEDEIKKAYRKKALELHPDRNYGKVEAATRQFADIQTAYEVLADPQERSWYDSHRDTILHDGDNINVHHNEHAVRITTTADILAVFTHYHGQLDYSDSERGFFSTVRGFFDNLSAEERESREWDSVDGQDFPGFGTAKDEYGDVAKPFYNIWSNFSTNKSFSWEDRFRTTEAPDRRVRRMMERENKRFRDEGVREFNEAVRSLVAFIKKRDPRYMPTSQSEADRQKTLRDAAAAQAARSRAANQAKLDEQLQPEWTKPDSATENFFEESSEGDREEFECIICSKVFKSEKQWQAHARSKKHLKAAQRLRKDMKIENDVLGLEKDKRLDGHDDNTDLAANDIKTENSTADGREGHESEEQQNYSNKLGDASSIASSQPSVERFEVESLSSDVDGVYAPRETAEVRVISPKVNQSSSDSGSISSIAQLEHSFANSALSADQEMASKTVSKRGKAKGKLARRAMKESEAQVREGKCLFCQIDFASRTQLFNHIEESKHARPLANANHARNQKGKRA